MGQRGYTAVCLTGSLRWPELTLPSLRHLLTLWMRDAAKIYYVGPADLAYASAKQLLTDFLQVPDERICAYPPNVSWAWRPPDLDSPATRSNIASATFSTIHRDQRTATTSTAFALHGSSACEGKERLTLNVAWLPFFRRCRDARFGLTTLPEGLPLEGERGWQNMFRYDRARAMPCAGALSLVMQLWQCAHCLELIEASERRWGGIPHDKVLRVRADLFFFRPVALPYFADSTQPWYSLMESTCNLQAGLHEMARKVRPQFFQDFWSYGTRSAMRVILREPLRRLLLYGLQQSNRSTHYVAALRRQRLAAATAVGATSGESTGGRSSGSGEAGATEDAADANESESGGRGGSSGDGGSLPISPKAFAVHPILYGLHFDLNASTCVPFADPVGLMRVNPHEMCYGVQARIKYASLSGWMQISIANLTGVKWHRRQRVIDEFEARVPKLARDRLPMAADVYARCLGLRSEQGCPRIIGDKMLRNGPAASCFRNRTDLEGASRARRRAGLPQLLGPRVNDADACGASEVLQLGKSQHLGEQPTSENAFLCVDDGLSKVYTDHPDVEDDFYSRSEPTMRMGGLAQEQMDAYWLQPDGDVLKISESQLTDGVGL